MLAVDHYELIRRKVVIEGKSQRDVAKELGHSLVRIDSVRYSLPVEWAYHPCVIKIFVDKIRVSCNRQLVAVH